MPRLKAAANAAMRRLPDDALWPGTLLAAALRATEDKIGYDSFKDCELALMGWLASKPSMSVHGCYWADVTPGMVLMRVVDNLMLVVTE